MIITRKFPVLRTLGVLALLPILAAGPKAHAQDVLTKSQTAPKAAPISKDFPISYWLGPTEKFTNLERYKEIKNAGMTFIMPQFESHPSASDNLKILDLTRKIGQKAFISDPRMPLKISGNPGATAALDAIIKDYGEHPALAGYHIIDEPNASLFAGLGEVVAYLKQKDPAHPAYINLFPNYANAAQLGTPTYEEYVRQFLKQVHPFVLSYDHYNLSKNGDGNNFYPNLDVMNRLSKEFDVPFWQIVQVVQFGEQRDLTEAELRYEAMQTLAYGGKGLLWFTYWQSRSSEFNWQHAMINVDGTRNPHYEMVKNVNAELRAIGSQLLRAESLEVFHSGQIPIGASGRKPGTLVDVTGAGNLTVGIFRHGSKEFMALVTNADYNHAVDTGVFVFSGNHVPKRFDTKAGRWVPAQGETKPGGFNTTLRIAPGDAVLLKW